jgi:hypothetical protein
MELHPLCTLFPRLPEAEFGSLVADIKANGLSQPIVTHDGMILDGGNRYRACVAAGIVPDFVEFPGGNLVSFVLSANLHRRHLTAGQQAAIVSSCQDWATAQGQGKPKTGNVAGLATVADRAAVSGASERTQRNADKVAKANPDLAKSVGHGKISLPKAVEQITGKKPGAKPAQPQDDIASLKEQLAESRENAKELGRDLERYSAVEAGEADKLIQRLQHENDTLKIRLNGVITERNEAIKDAKYWRKQAEKLGWKPAE